MATVVKIRKSGNMPFGFMKVVKFDSEISQDIQSDAGGSWEIHNLSNIDEAKEFSELMQKKYPHVKYRIQAEDGVADWGSGWISENRTHSYQF